MKTTIDFFDAHAHTWDSHIKKKDRDAIVKILARSGFKPEDNVLDVGTGTGVLVPFFHDFGVKNITAIDFSPEMCRIFTEKFPGIKIITGDYTEKHFQNDAFDKIMIFNAFPHFKDPKAVFDNSFNYLKKNGMLIIAHSMNRTELNAHHSNCAKIVKNDMLVSDDEFKKHFHRVGLTQITVEDDKYFYASGIKA